jgi:hypothetical protein
MTPSALSAELVEVSKGCVSKESVFLALCEARNDRQANLESHTKDSP